MFNNKINKINYDILNLKAENYDNSINILLYT